METIQHDIKLGYITYKEADHIRQVFKSEGYKYGTYTYNENKIDYNIFIEAEFSGSFNTAFGCSALYVNNSGNCNVALGYQALQANYTYNTAIGTKAIVPPTPAQPCFNLPIAPQALAPICGIVSTPPNPPPGYCGSFGSSSLNTYREPLPETDQIPDYQLQINKDFVIVVYNTEILKNRIIKEALLEYLV